MKNTYFLVEKNYDNDIIKNIIDESNIKIIHLNNETTCKLINYKNFGYCLITKNLSYDGPLKICKLNL